MKAPDETAKPRRNAKRRAAHQAGAFADDRGLKKRGRSENLLGSMQPMSEDDAVSMQERFAHTFSLCAIEALMETDPKKRTRQGRFLIALANAVEKYEKERYPFTAPTQPRAKQSA